MKQTTRTDDATADQLIAVYKKGRPDKSNVEIYQIIASDATFSGSVHTEADRKVAQGKAPVYKYSSPGNRRRARVSCGRSIRWRSRLCSRTWTKGSR